MKPLLLSLVSLFSPLGGGVNRLVVPHGFLFLFLTFLKNILSLTGANKICTGLNLNLKYSLKKFKIKKEIHAGPPTD